MQTKAYFASSIPAALEAARQELGDNALLVSSRPALPQARQFGRLEVTFAWDPKQLDRQQLDLTPAKRTTAITRPPATPAASDLDEIRQQLSALRVAVGRGGELPGAKPAQAPREESLPNKSLGIADRLVDAGFSGQTASEIAAVAAGRSGDPDTAVEQEIASRIPTASFVEMKTGESRTLAFIGPPGRGKTTSLVKIAVSLGLARSVPVRIYCAGAHAIGAQEQLARFAAILGTPYQACESLTSLSLALKGEAWKGLSLIDTPGISPADRNELGELRNFLAARTEIEKHLVLRSDASSADMLHMISRFSGLAPSRLLFTGMDEAVRAAPMVEALIRAGIPATFGGNGQQIPEDLEELDADKLARAVWAGRSVSSDAAATGSAAPKVRFAHAAG